jgi:parallel beta-helix repeat protein
LGQEKGDKNMLFKGKKPIHFASRNFQKFSLAIILSLLLIIPFSAMLFVQRAKADGMPVHNTDTKKDYATIQEAIDAPETLTGNTIRVDAGTYFENVVVSKSITLIGADMTNTIINGGDTDYTIKVTANDFKISGFTITNGGCPAGELPAGILLSSVTGCNITGNIVSGNPFFGIWILSSSDNSVSGNTITDNVNAVQLDWGASNNAVSGNSITANDNNGVAFSSGGSNNIISGNSITANPNHGVELYSTSGNIISGNNIANNGVGVYLFGSTTDNSIYHNRFNQNSEQVYTDTGITNKWDNDYPSGGNYWSDYTGVDQKSGPNQNQAGSDGLGDTSYTINTNNIDGYPLYGLWNAAQFQVDINGQLTQIIIETNAAITDASSTLNTLDFTAGGLSPFSGCIRAIIPSPDTANLQVTVDGDLVDTLIETDGTNDYVFFQFPFTTHQIEFLFGVGASVFLNTPAINGKTVDINGGATPGDKVTQIDWNWGDGTVEPHFFPNSHTYASGGTYTVTVTAHYEDESGTFTASKSVDVTVGEGIKSGGFTLTIDNSAGGGTVSYSSSLGDGSVPSGGSVDLYLAAGDPVWDIGATPDSGHSFDSWTVSGDDVAIMQAYDQYSNPVAVLVNSDGAITVNFTPSFVVPEYLYGALLAMAACFAAFFIIIKRPNLKLRTK